MWRQRLLQNGIDLACAVSNKRPQTGHVTRRLFVSGAPSVAA